MNENELEKIIIQIEDYLIPFLNLDTYEKALYYHLFRHSKLIGKNELQFVISSAPKTVQMTDYSARDRIRKLDKKGCIRILETTRDGLQIELYLPEQISGCIPPKSQTLEEKDIEQIDFYKEAKFRPSILKRENNQCFYCFRKINLDNYVLDHVLPQVSGGSNSYKNIVASCHECNSKKSGKTGDDYVRDLYRSGLLSSKELDKKLKELELLTDGKLKPEIT
ncbi:hypothetical protein CH364_09790 [Leptospira harrisiae]|uniref:HNH nuclease domain-containing protein n=1 Tax=Leptospira harrisiae TaxID=2023189 RepID=A0A2N0AQ95_9LEPT|nr:HNH endonuclease signature motif containing protein [Leptospira harrisiae]PJZ86430.1 hypothetical protein CH364_09790 [Leptospira harrisiae]